MSSLNFISSELALIRIQEQGHRKIHLFLVEPNFPYPFWLKMISLSKCKNSDPKKACCTVNYSTEWGWEISSIMLWNTNLSKRKSSIEIIIKETCLRRSMTSKKNTKISMQIKTKRSCPLKSLAVRVSNVQVLTLILTWCNLSSSMISTNLNIYLLLQVAVILSLASPSIMNLLMIRTYKIILTEKCSK